MIDLIKRVDPWGDPLAPYRQRIMYGLSAAAVVLLLPFSVNAYIQGNVGLGTGILCALLILAIDALAIYLERRPPIPLILLLVPITVGMAISLKVQGFFGALWSYPAVLLFTFALSRRMANLCNVLLLSIISGLVYYYIGLDYTIRFFATLTLTILLANIILSIVVDLHRRLIDQASVDPLTGAFNRRHMERSLADAIERQRRTSAPASLLLIDIDHFKQVNDTRGHLGGDRLLEQLGAHLRAGLRDLDSVARYGGDEFLVRIHARDGDAVAIARRILDTWIELGDVPAFSVGIATHRRGIEPQSTFADADRALYVSKNEGRARIEVARV
jgi:diguanylate cyclase (GGDEF)-like protein